MQLVGPASRCTTPPRAKPERKARARSARSATPRSSTISACRRTKSSTFRRWPAISTDNVPGAPGIGVKTAAQLINEYGDLETLLARAGEIKQPKRRETLTDRRASRGSASRRHSSSSSTTCRSKRRSTTCACIEPDGKTLVGFLQGDGVHDAHPRVAEIYGADVALDRARSRLRRARWLARPQWRCRRDRRRPQAAKRRDRRRSDAPASRSPHAAPSSSPTALAERSAVKMRIDRSYETVFVARSVSTDWIAAAFDAGFVAFDTETTSLDPMQAELVGVSLAIAPGRACYIPLAAIGARRRRSLRRRRSRAGPDCRWSAALARLKPLLEDARGPQDRA